jgi:hypothetical protein
MSLIRQFHRHGKGAQEPKPRGVPGQRSRHIIARGIRTLLRKATNRAAPTGYDYFLVHQPVELHATKGWRTVRSWS